MTCWNKWVSRLMLGQISDVIIWWDTQIPTRFQNTGAWFLLHWFEWSGEENRMLFLLQLLKYTTGAKPIFRASVWGKRRPRRVDTVSRQVAYYAVAYCGSHTPAAEPLHRKLLIGVRTEALSDASVVPISNQRCPLSRALETVITWMSLTGQKQRR